MFYDYGKRAYLKVLDLEKSLNKRIEELENKSYRSLFFNLSSPERYATYDKSIKFIAKTDGAVKCTVIFKAPETISVSYKITSGDKVLVSGGTNGALISNINFEFGTLEGENGIAIRISSGIPIPLDELKVFLEGTVDYYECKRRLSSVTYGDLNYITFLNDNCYQLYSYDGSLLKFRHQKDGILDACIGGVVNGELYIITLTEEHGVTVTLYDVADSFSVTTRPLVSNVTSISAFPFDDGVKIIFIKSGTVCIGFYSRSAGFSYETTSRRAKEVFADADVPNAYILYDDYKPIKFIV